MQSEKVEAITEEEKSEESYNQLHNSHRGNVVVVGHGSSHFCSPQRIMHEVHFAASDGSLDVVVVGSGMKHEALLPLVDQWHSKQEEHCHTKIGNQH